METNQFKQKDWPITKVVKYGCVPVFGLFILIVVIAIAIPSRDTKLGTLTTKTIDTLALELHAKYIGQEAVKRLLKSPASAQFPVEEQKYRVSSDSTVLIIGAVDAQNTFGALLRNNFYVQLKWKGDYTNLDNWQVLESKLIE